MIYWIVPYSMLYLAGLLIFATIFFMIAPQRWLMNSTPPRIPKLLPERTAEMIVIEIVDE